MREAEPSKMPLRVIRSRRRKRTISGEIKNGELVIRAPAGMSDLDLQPHIQSLRERLEKRASKRRSTRSDDDLVNIARSLNRKYFAGKLTWTSIRFVTNMQKRFGSCTPSQGTIRISDRLAKMPQWVLEYVVMHELAHLLEANHGPGFWRLVNQFPKTERARGYLIAVGLESDLDVPAD